MMRQAILGIALFACVSAPVYGQVVELQAITDPTEIPDQVPKDAKAYKVVHSDYEQSKRSQPQVGDFAALSRSQGNITDSPISLLLLRPTTGRYLVWRSVRGEVAANGTYLLAANTSTVLTQTGTTVGTSAPSELAIREGYPRNPVEARASKQRAAAGGQPAAIRGINAAQAATAPKKKSGLFGALVGAAGGALGVAALGGNGAAMLDAASQMANMIAPNTTGGSAVSAITGTLSGKQTTALQVATTGQGVTSPGSYQTKPNLADGPACAGFTETNYREVALSGGLDVQLKTMCGQAFEYYTMYKRAIAQGYSEADSNRTYDAHEKSAIVANSFYANNRAE